MQFYSIKVICKWSDLRFYNFQIISELSQSSWREDTKEFNEIFWILSVSSLDTYINMLKYTCELKNVKNSKKVCTYFNQIRVFGLMKIGVLNF